MEEQQVDLWEKKLLAFLHDPPCKPLDIAGHNKARETFIRQAGFDPADIREFDKECDWTAAAADRFPFPMASCLKSSFSGSQDEPFRHPLGGSDFCFDKPIPSSALAEDEFQTVQKGIDIAEVPKGKRTWANFFLHWRRWPVEAAQKDPRTYFMPADTRLPDHNIWCHNSIVSALQTCLSEKGELRPAFLLFRLGPVQEFIEQARSTRDLWSGSYLLSWLIAHAIKAVTDEIGPDTVIYPSLRGQLIFDLLHRDELYRYPTYTNGKGDLENLWDRMKEHEKEMLIPNLPNRFLAVVPAERAEALARGAGQAVHSELKNIAEACWQWFGSETINHPLKAGWKSRFDRQVEMFPQITWEVLPWLDSIEDNLKSFATMYDGANTPAENLASLHELAVSGIPEAHRDERYFFDKEKKQHLNNQGFCWPYFYADTDRLLAARRNTRDFEFWKTDEAQTGAVKDSFSGKEEVVGNEEWWKSLRENDNLKRLFRSEDQLGAMNLIKKVWHKPYLEASEKWGIDVRKAVNFASTPGVAAGMWRKRLLQAMQKDKKFYDAVLNVVGTIKQHAPSAGVEVSESKDVDRWVEKTDPECFVVSTWERAGKQIQDNPELFNEVIGSLRRLYDKRNGMGFDNSPSYYAVIALDGDEMGKWVSGEKTPFFNEQLSAGARKYFDGLRQDILHVRRPLSPSYHLQFGEALSNFALYVVRPVVERFGGQLIYAGGDDVLTMAPAESAFDCAQALRSAFRGEKGPLERLVPGLFQVEGINGGFLKLANPKAEQPTWPLVVPGPCADISAGIAVGHVHSPLQNLVHAAHEVQQKAKYEYGRSAFAVSLHKRSGEILEWGEKWDSGALDLLREFIRLSSDDGSVFSNRFPYALSSLLDVYTEAEGLLTDADDFNWSAIVQSEFVHVVVRQSLNPRTEEDESEDRTERKRRFIQDVKQYIRENCKDRKTTALFATLFKVAAFLQRGKE